jgi:hypothetical protein
MSIKLGNLVISKDDTLSEVDGFSKLLSVISSLHQSGLLPRMSGNCVGAVDILGNMLYQRGIKSYVVECQVSVDSPVVGVSLIGYDNFLTTDSSNPQVDTHTALIVILGDTQVLVDVSIPYALPSYHPVIVERLNGVTPDVLSEYKFDDFNIIYTAKKSSKLPFLHQTNLVSALVGEKKNGERIDGLKKIIYVAIGISVINFILNTTLITLKLLFL